MMITEPLPRRRRTLRRATTAALAALTLAVGSSASATDGQAFDWRLPPWMPPPPVPADNPMGEAKVELGRRLFYDIRLSGTGYMACATCHDPRRAFTDGRVVAIGSMGERLSLNTPSLAGVGYMTALSWWDPTAHSLEEQSLRPMFGERPTEMGIGGHERRVIEHLAFNPIYAGLFHRAFPERDGAIDFETVRMAIAAFQRTLVSARSPYDRHRHGGDAGALSEAARRGEALFMSERLGCGQCHSGPHLSDAIPQARYHNTGQHNIDGRGGLPAGNRGLIEQTGQPGDMGRFRTPSLRNVAVTAPYMHDGSLPSLEAVIAHYAAGGEAARRGARSPLASPLVQPFSITEAETRDLIAFLDSLTDQEFLADARLQTPFR